jgi:hypothetical protein
MDIGARLGGHPKPGSKEILENKILLLGSGGLDHYIVTLDGHFNDLAAGLLMPVAAPVPVETLQEGLFGVLRYLQLKAGVRSPKGNQEQF